MDDEVNDARMLIKKQGKRRKSIMCEDMKQWNITIVGNNEESMMPE